MRHAAEFSGDSANSVANVSHPSNLEERGSSRLIIGRRILTRQKARKYMSGTRKNELTWRSEPITNDDRARVNRKIRSCFIAASERSRGDDEPAVKGKEMSAVRCVLCTDDAAQLRQPQSPILAFEIQHAAGRKPTAFFLALISAVLLAVAATPRANANPSLDYVGSWGGWVDAVYVDPAEPDIAYIGSGQRLVILDVSDPADVTEIGSINLGHLVRAIKVKNGYAFIGTHAGPNYLCIVNVQDVENPQLIWTSPNYWAGGVKDVELYGDYAYVKFGTQIQILNVADVAAPERAFPRIVQTSTVFAGYAAISDHYLYVSNTSKPNRILDVFDLQPDPAHPLRIASLTLGTASSSAGYDCDIATDGHYVYLTDDDEGRLDIVDVSNPAAPVYTGTAPLYWPTGLDVANGYAFVADWFEGYYALPQDRPDQGLAIYDVTANPGHANLITSYQTHGSVSGVSVVGSRAYVMDEGEGLIILDVSDPAAPVRIGGYYSPSRIFRVAKNGDIMYVLDQLNGMGILDVSNPNRPRYLGSYQTPPGATDNWDISYRNGRVYLSEGEGGFEIIDVSNPFQPTRIGGFSPWPDGVEAMAIAINPVSDILHVGTQPGAYLVNFNVSNPAAISMAGWVSLGGGAPNVYEIELNDEGTLAYLSRDLAFQIIDVSDPNMPVIVNSKNINSPGLGLDSGNQTCYVSIDGYPASNGGFDAYSVANPAALELLSHNTGRIYATDIAHGGGDIIVEASLGDVRALDVSDPALPALLASYDTVDYSRVHVDGRYIFASKHAHYAPGAGLIILELNDYWPEGDLNFDRCVDLSDLSIQLSNFGCTSDCQPSDVDADGDVDIADVSVLLSNFGKCN